ncbi:nucleotide sugar dehydrogenase, partial [bacterium]|nr:nucleotide sugar dehydrogenase [bacterium]
MKINKALVFGAGYVGTSLAVLLSQEIKVLVIDNDEDIVHKLNNKESPIEDLLVDRYLYEKSLDLQAQTNIDNSICNYDVAILALPTNYNPETNYFDTNIIEDVIFQIQTINKNIPILIKSTVPIGFTKRMRIKYPECRIVFSPEFLREGNSLHDNIYPSRIVVGDKKEVGELFGNLLFSFAKNNPQILLMDSCEAEAVKLFANTYLATRVTFFNELDSYCLNQNLDAESVIRGISLDPRIGEGYNNPSFGYGGYCLPKDTKQLLANFESIPQGIFTAVVDGNSKRKSFIADQVMSLNPESVGIYRLIMKEGSDN